jgi:hypothetical protein
MNALQSLLSVAAALSSPEESAGFGSGFDDAAAAASRSTVEAVVEAQLVALEALSGHELIALFLTASAASSIDNSDPLTDGSNGGSAWKYIKDLLVIDDSFLRSVMISRLGYLLIKLLILISSDDTVAHTIEGSMDNASSSADTKRTIDGAVDTVVDLIRCFALGVRGRAPAPSKDNPLLVLVDDFCCRNAYSEVLVYLIGRWVGRSMQHKS